LLYHLLPYVEHKNNEELTHKIATLKVDIINETVVEIDLLDKETLYEIPPPLEM
jgi:hypothetical protein